MKLKHLQFFLILIDAETWLQEPGLRAHTLRKLHDNLRYDLGFILVDAQLEFRLFEFQGHKGILAVFPSLHGKSGGTEPGITRERWGSLYVFLALPHESELPENLQEQVNHITQRAGSWVTYKHPRGDNVTLAAVPLQQYLDARDLMAVEMAETR